MRRLGLLALGSLVVAGAGTACFYGPPEILPSSIRILYSKAVTDSLGSRTEIYFLVARSGNELRLTADQGEDRQPVFADEIRRVFFTREVDGRSEIWSMNLDGTDEERIVGGGSDSYRDPTLSPDESRIAYTVESAGGGSRVEIANRDGGEARVVVGGNARWRQPAWSPDGRRLAIVGDPDGTPRVYLVDATDGEPRPLTSGPTVEFEPAWSPDGGRIALVRGRREDAEIAVVDVASGEGERITDNDVEDAGPAWSPSGDRIAFTSRRPHGRWNLWIVAPDGDDLDSLTRSENADAYDPDWI